MEKVTYPNFQQKKIAAALHNANIVSNDENKVLNKMFETLVRDHAFQPIAMGATIDLIQSGQIRARVIYADPAKAATITTEMNTFLKAYGIVEWVAICSPLEVY